MRRGRSRYVGMVLVFLLGASRIGSAQVSPLKQFSAILPAGEGKILVFKHCVACHGPALIQKRLEAGKAWPLNYWQDLVVQMIQGWGATIETEEVDPIARYLAANFRAAPPLPQPTVDALLPAGKEKDLFAAKCFACHDREMTARRIALRTGLPASVWNKLLARMRSYGARLNGDEIEQLSAYLEHELTSRSDAADPNGLKSLSSRLPDREGRSVVLAVCLSCHGADEIGRRIESAPAADPYYWERVVKRMQSRWEAPFEDADVDVTITYLNSLASQ